MERLATLHHLRQGWVLPYRMGMEIYLLGCRQHLHISGYTDGIYHWPESLLHYLTHYAVRLPNEFTEHVWPLPTFLTATVAAVDENTETDFTWWKTQQGQQSGASSLHH